MSRYSAPSDLDYYDEPWKRPIWCANPACDQQAEQVGWLCRDCEDMERASAERQRRTNERRGRGAA